MRFLSVLIILLFSFTYSAAQESITIKEGDMIDVSFSTQLDADDLEDIKNQLADLNITLEYKSLEFNKKGKLKAIDFKVDCNDGHSGSASAKLLTKNFIARFYRDYNENTKSSFGTSSGRIKELAKMAKKKNRL